MSDSPSKAALEAEFYVWSALFGGAVAGLVWILNAYAPAWWSFFGAAVLFVLSVLFFRAAITAMILRWPWWRDGMRR